MHSLTLELRSKMHQKAMALPDFVDSPGESTLITYMTFNTGTTSTAILKRTLYLHAFMHSLASID